MPGKLTAKTRDVRVIEETGVIQLSARDSRAFARALLKPREPTVQLKEAAQRYLKQISGR